VVEAIEGRFTSLGKAHGGLAAVLLITTAASSIMTHAGYFLLEYNSVYAEGSPFQLRIISLCPSCIHGLRERRAE
jgi:hypothetical protein